jgi:hypothetical protein
MKTSAYGDMYQDMQSSQNDCIHYQDQFSIKAYDPRVVEGMNPNPCRPSLTSPSFQNIASF